MKKKKITNETGSTSKPDINPIVPAEDKAKRRLELEKVVDAEIGSFEETGHVLAEIMNHKPFNLTQGTK